LPGESYTIAATVSIVLREVGLKAGLVILLVTVLSVGCKSEDEGAAVDSIVPVI
jgi:hypothetical protein